MIDSGPQDVLYGSQTGAISGNTRAAAYLNDDGRDWHVWIPKPGMAKIACDRLEDQGFPTYEPKLITRAFSSGASKLVTTDLFPGYRFVKFSEDDRSWPKICFTIGVRRLLLATNLKPVTVPARPMRRLLDYPVIYDDNVAADPTIVGATVAVLDGPFAHMRGEVLKSSSGRVVVLLGLFGNAFPASTPLSNVVRYNG